MEEKLTKPEASALLTAFCQMHATDFDGPGVYCAQIVIDEIHRKACGHLERADYRYKIPFGPLNREEWEDVFKQLSRDHGWSQNLLDPGKRVVADESQHNTNSDHYIVIGIVHCHAHPHLMIKVFATIKPAGAAA